MFFDDQPGYYSHRAIPPRTGSRQAYVMQPLEARRKRLDVWFDVAETKTIRRATFLSGQTTFQEEQIRKKFVFQVFALLSFQFIFYLTIISLFFSLNDFKDQMFNNPAILYGFGGGALFVYVILIIAFPLRRIRPINLILVTILMVMIGLVVAGVSTTYDVQVVTYGFAIECSIIIFITLLAKFAPFAGKTSGGRDKKLCRPHCSSNSQSRDILGCKCCQTVKLLSDGAPELENTSISSFPDLFNLFKCDVVGCGMIFCVLAVVFCVFGVVASLILLLTKFSIVDLLYAGCAVIIFSLYLMFDTQAIMDDKTLDLKPNEFVRGNIHLYLDVVLVVLHLIPKCFRMCFKKKPVAEEEPKRRPSRGERAAAYREELLKMKKTAGGGGKPGAGGAVSAAAVPVVADKTKKVPPAEAAKKNPSPKPNPTSKAKV